MDILIDVVLPLSLAFIMLSLGLGLTIADFTRVLSFPKAFLIGFAGQLLLLPVVAYLMVTVFGPRPEIAVGVMILALCPGGVTSNVLTRIAQGSVALSVTLTAVMSLLSVLTLPLLVAWSAQHFMGTQAPQINVTSLAVAMFLITTVPVALGVLVRHLAPRLADRIEPFAARAAVLLFVLIVIAALAANWDLFARQLPVIGPLLIVFNLILIALGLLAARLASLSEGEGRAVALEMGVQNGTLGITVAGLIAGSAGIPTLAFPSALYGITMYLCALPAILWMRRRPLMG